MKTVFFLIATVCSLVGAYFAYSNSQKFEAETAEIQKLDKQKKNIIKSLTKKEKELKAQDDDIQQTEAALAEATATLDSGKSKEANLKRTLAGYEAELLETQEELDTVSEVKDQIEAALASVSVSDISEIPDKIKSIKVEAQETTDEIDNNELIIEKLKTKISSEKESLANTNKRLVKIKSNISGNGVSATVTSVSSQWGFVVINKGASNSPITEGTELLVERSGRYIGKMKVATLENAQSICDLDINGFRNGVLPRPGDRVILRDTVPR